MTDDEQNKAIAEATGIFEPLAENESFTESLDWMHIAEQTLTPEQFIDYVDKHLFAVCYGLDRSKWSPGTKWTPAMVHASAAQRAESFLRALNLWID